MINPLKKLSYYFSLQAAIDSGFAYKHKPPPMMSAEKRKTLMEESGLATPRGKLRSLIGVVTPYLTKAGPKEFLIATTLLAASLYLNKFSIDMTGDYGNWIGSLTNTVTQLVQAVSSQRPEIIKDLLDQYPLIQEALNQHPLLNEMLLKYPDGSQILQDPQFKEFLSAHQGMKELMGKNFSLESMFMQYPEFAKNAAENPAYLEQLSRFRDALGDRLQDLPSVKETLSTMLDMCGGAFFDNTWSALKTAFNTAAGHMSLPDFLAHPIDSLTNIRNPFGAETAESLKKLWYSNDLATMVLKYTGSTLGAYKSSQYLALRWRAWSTGYYTSKFIHKNAFERIKTDFPNIDNPGQRLQEDPNKFTAATVALMTGVTAAGMTLNKFAGELWDIGPVMGVDGGFFWIGLVYSAALLGITTYLAHKYPEILRNKQRVEANLRSSTDNIHNNAEQIALTNSAAIEQEIVRKNVGPVAKNSLREIGTQLKMIVTDSTVGNLSIPLPYLVVSFAAIAGGTGSMGTVATLNYAFNRVSTSLGFIVNNFEKISNWIATSQRIYALDKAIDAAHYIEEEKRLAGTKAGASLPPRQPGF